MPNWCNNTLEITHSDPAMIERARSAFADGRLLDEFHPVPNDLKIVAGRVGADDDQAQKDLVAQEQANRTKYGYANWYDWCVNEWGTKWDVGGNGYEAQDIPNGLIMTFDSAWAPPVRAMEQLVDLGFDVRLMYYEPGMAFCGVWENNDDDYYEIGGMSSGAIAAMLPTELDEAFGISEQVAEYEAEEAQDE
jgi:hypothetical protein